MTKCTVEIDDTLQERVDGAVEEVEAKLRSHLEQNPDTDRCPDWGTLDYSGSLHEIIDSSVPVYTSEIRDIFYLHGDEVEDAFDDAGIGTKEDAGWPMGWKAVAIYCYIEQAAYQWYRDSAEDIFTEWREKQDRAGQ